MYFPPLSVSLILIQFIPSGSVVRYCLIGRGEPPRAISKTAPRRTHSHDSGISKGISSSIHTSSEPRFS